MALALKVNLCAPFKSGSWRKLQCVFGRWTWGAGSKTFVFAAVRRRRLSRKTGSQGDERDETPDFRRFGAEPFVWNQRLG
jgi:hypothetical protein